MGLLPREGRFLDAFNQHAALAVAAARERPALFDDLASLDAHSKAIEHYEKQAGRIVSAWVLTIPCSGLIVAAAWWVARLAA